MAYGDSPSNSTPPMLWMLASLKHYTAYSLETGRFSST